MSINPIHAVNREAKDQRIRDTVRRMRAAGETAHVAEIAQRAQAGEGYVRRFLARHGLSDVIRTWREGRKT